MVEGKVDQDRALLRLSDVSRWGDELRGLKAKREELDAEIRVLEHKLSAAKFFMDEVLHPASSRQRTNFRNEVPEPLPEAIKNVLREAGKPLTNSEIRDGLSHRRNYSTWSKRPSYFYTAMKRLRDRNLLVKDGKRYSLAQQEFGASGSFEPDAPSNQTDRGGAPLDTDNETR